MSFIMDTLYLCTSMGHWDTQYYNLLLQGRKMIPQDVATIIIMITIIITMTIIIITGQEDDPPREDVARVQECDQAKLCDSLGD